MSGRTVRVQRPGMQRAMIAVTAAVVVVALSATFRSIEASGPTSDVGPARPPFVGWCSARGSRVATRVAPGRARRAGPSQPQGPGGDEV